MKNRVLFYYEYLLHCSEALLMDWIDLYNEGRLCADARTAMEIIESVD